MALQPMGRSSGRSGTRGPMSTQCATVYVYVPAALPVNCFRGSTVVYAIHVVSSDSDNR